MNTAARVAERFWSKVDTSGGPDACWPWKSATNEHGYGLIRYGKQNARAHRVALAGGFDLPPPSVKALHSCDNPPCCNPAHLRWGTQSDNMLDAINRGRRTYPERIVKVRPAPKPLAGRFSHAEHCVHGHPFSAENTMLKPNPIVQSGYERVCRICRTRRSQEAAARRKQRRAMNKEK